MKKIFLLILSLFFLFPANVSAESEFLTKAEVVYDVGEDGVTTVTNNITLTNVFSNLYATSYAMQVEGLEPTSVKAVEAGQVLPVTIEKDGEKTVIRVEFERDVVGKGKQRNFTISFTERSLAVKTGEVWETAVPKLGAQDSFDSYTLILQVPKSFGQAAFISPQPITSSEKDNKYRYVFDKDSASAHGVTAAFGRFQVFEFNLVYHLENPLTKTAVVGIAIPPDTAFQKVNYKTLDPAPEVVQVDQDGNWIATYKLTSRQRLDVRATGAVQIFATERQFPKPNSVSLQQNLLATDVWQTTDPRIINLAKQLITPKQIYDYVVATLIYDYDRVRPNINRLGAIDALANPGSAICMEFTDLFVALARAAGIPAREVNGYAYTENRQLQPLSLVADVLHAWPEYWDDVRGVWVPIDPTWGSTTGGVDFFTKLDLRHFAFVMHGINPDKPFPPGSYKLGANPQKDVYVAFGSLPSQRKSIPKIEIEVQKALPFMATSAKIIVKNDGPVALYDLNVLILFDTKIETEKTIAILPVYGKQEYQVSIPFSILGVNTPQNIKVVVGGNSLTAPSSKNWVILMSLATIFLIIGLTIGFIYWRVKIHENNS
ncbi:hypothetical protein A2630_00265 [Candidatus Woesebacteria bacterium RIFCSPHIGHO2_01_FULL_44_10]|uniref:Transglutaminase-like domain-containing protein n=1 Tax=Candidatus Woesebacteria bacterium RIFCSPLOWO2_01_FULL_44_14 TaxID=1802525 RepID=A0A1F8BXE3_9BACT|nr:MAG: hypothetical protein A2630_00265 [Candidatus Woesebacteria bacterium RIFCSPHIGHO2_01_FULL_44_10]OGM55801.1 MAG: hypothetical protein A3F62_04220 [Candidatus Woesebacteria bacterium RIFCSPHIGHO2_12_FULL_44_11]OGM68737.1 MAG: hypothetical protein A2975_05565 [Candidatus Woesebacteria bacterium RIFCSPLOWO2_01_FULL_44_14]